VSRASFTIAYDGPALQAGVMDVRDLAPALLAVGQLFDAANSVLNAETAQVSVSVRATSHGSFEIAFQVAQTLQAQLTALFSSDTITAAINLKELVVGAGIGLIWLIRRLRGRQPDKIEKISEQSVRLTIDGEVFEVPLKLMRLYQDLAVRAAAEKVVAEPLRRDGIDTFEIREDTVPVLTVNKDEAAHFAKPTLPEETLVETTRRAAFSIIPLAFKEENKWRLYDGNTQISGRIDDEGFQQRVDSSQVAFSKGDILLCDVKITQKRTDHGLSTEYVVEKVVEHRPAARQLPLPFDETGTLKP
jgi:hypothetical protein